MWLHLLFLKALNSLAFCGAIETTRELLLPTCLPNLPQVGLKAGCTEKQWLVHIVYREIVRKSTEVSIKEISKHYSGSFNEKINIRPFVSLFPISLVPTMPRFGILKWQSIKCMCYVHVYSHFSDYQTSSLYQSKFKLKILKYSSQPYEIQPMIWQHWGIIGY